jgi:hypothetical protein
VSHNPASDTVTAQQSPPTFDFAPAYQGVDLAYQSWPYALDPAAEEKSRLQNVNVARVDLLEPGISFYTTPASDPSCANQTIGRTCTEFLQENPAVLLAINANFSWYEGQDVSGAYFVLFGLAMSNGDVVCDPSVVAWRTSGPGLVDVPDETWVGAVALLITPDNHASIQTVTANQPIDTSTYQTAIAGSAQPMPNTTWPPQKPVPGPLQVLVNGQNNGVPQASPAEEVAGRTGVGLSQDGNTLYLLTIDGLEKQGDYGADFYDLGAWLQLAGAYNGFNLDGGGSTTMARREPNNAEPILVNQPHGNETSAVVERAVGNFFGVIAPWLQ